MSELTLDLRIAGLDPDAGSALASALRLGDAPQPISLNDVALKPRFGGEESTFLVNALLTIALGVPSGIIANYLWEKITAVTDTPAAVEIVIDGVVIRAESRESLEQALEAVLQARGTTARQAEPK